MMKRKDYLDKLVSAVKSGRSVQLVGPRGVGKTALLKDLVKALGQTDINAVFVSCQHERLENGSQFWQDLQGRTPVVALSVIILDDFDWLLSRLGRDPAFANGLYERIITSKPIVVSARKPLSSSSKYASRLGAVFQKMINMPLGPLSNEESFEFVKLLVAPEKLAQQFPEIVTLTVAASGGLPGIAEEIIKSHPTTSEDVRSAADKALNSLSASLMEE